TYKEATLNPTNPADRATDWEADVVNAFRNNPSLPYLYRERDTALGKSLFLAYPLRVVATGCLDCHSVPSRAPATMIREYGPDNGFGWKLDEIIGAQIVSVPESVPLQMAHNALKTLIIYVVAVAVLMLLALDTLLVVTVIRPVAKLSRMADEI